MRSHDLYSLRQRYDNVYYCRRTNLGFNQVGRSIAMADKALERWRIARNQIVLSYWRHNRRKGLTMWKNWRRP